MAEQDITKREYLAQFFLRIIPIPVKTAQRPNITKIKTPVIAVGNISLNLFKCKKIEIENVLIIKMPMIVI